MSSLSKTRSGWNEPECFRLEDVIRRGTGRPRACQVLGAHKGRPHVDKGSW
jgi:hypothetical protein